MKPIRLQNPLRERIVRALAGGATMKLRDLMVRAEAVGQRLPLCRALAQLAKEGRIVRTQEKRWRLCAIVAPAAPVAMRTQSAEPVEQVMADVGRKVAELRRYAGLTQAQLADRLDKPVQDLQNIELGKRNLTLRSLSTIAGGLGVPTRLLLDPPLSQEPRRRGRPLRQNAFAEEDDED